MSELLNDRVLSTTDLVNPPRTAADATEPAISHPNASAHSDNFVIDSAGDMHEAELEAVPGQSVLRHALFPQNELENFRSRWSGVQTSFVDEPRVAVERADSLVSNVIEMIAEQFASEREQLERQWDGGKIVDTEDLRQALKRYRAFFDRLLAV